MMRVMCDCCGKELRPGEDHHYVVKMEIFATTDPTQLTESDLEEDHIEAISQMLQQATNEESDPFPPPCQHLRYDLCSACRQRFVKDPLGKEAAPKLQFSEN